MLKNYLKIALRNLLRNKLLSLINIAGLSLGLACCMLILLYTKDEVSFDGFHDKKEQLYRLTCEVARKDEPVEKYGITAMVQGPVFNREIPEIKEIVRVCGRDFIVKKDAETFNESIVWADDNFFSVFSFPLISGDPKSVFKEINSLVLSEEMAKKYFGSTPKAIGKTLEVEIYKEGKAKFEPFVVSGIARNCPQNSSIQFKMLMPFKYYEKINPDKWWFNLGYPTFLVMNPKTDVKAVTAKMKQVFEKHAAEQLIEERKHGFDAHYTYSVQPFLAMHLDNSYVGYGIAHASNPVYSYILLGIALFILLIACINFINLTIAQSLKRGKEIGLRKVVGGQRNQLIAQFLGESFFVTFLAFAMACVLAELALPAFNNLANKQLSLSYLFDFQLLIGFIILFVLTGLVAGVYPALVLSGFHPVQILYNRTKFRSKNYLGKSLVVIQFALATFLMIATLFIYQQFNYLTTKDLGYNDENLLEISVGQGGNKKLQQTFKEQFAQCTGVLRTALQMDGAWVTNSKANQKDITVKYEHIDEDYLPLLGVPIIAGRNFSKDFPADSSGSVLVNEAYISAAGWKDDPVGKTIDFLNGQHTQLRIIGVVKDYHYESLKEEIRPQLFSTSTELPFGAFLIRISPYNIPKTIKDIESIYKKLTPYRPFVYNFRDDLNYRGYEAEAKWKQIISFSALITIFISCIGLFGLALLASEARQKEIGIRKVLGASIKQIVTLLSVDFVKLVLIAFVIAVPLAWYVIHQWLQNFAYRIEITWWVFALAGMLALLVALITVSFQSIKAAMLNPVEALRNE
ncbi:MAG: ABC transporter permease [Microscillaceae bacterium]|nr:ABC transporter permease [Microscillaceae bacterium]